MRAKRKAFDENVNKVLSKAYNPDDFKDNPDMSDMDTPTYDMYKDDDEGAYSQVLDIDDVSPDTYDCYVGAEVELPIGDKVVSGKVSKDKRGKTMALSRGQNTPTQFSMLILTPEKYKKI
jgi:hypothetical protein